MGRACQSRAAVLVSPVTEDIVLDPTASIFRPAEPVADWAAKVLEEAPAAVQAARALVLAYLALAFSIQ